MIANFRGYIRKMRGFKALRRFPIAPDNAGFLTVDQEVGGSNPPSCTNKINDLAWDDVQIGRNLHAVFTSGMEVVHGHWTLAARPASKHHWGVGKNAGGGMASRGK
jgi:hypothetical protein